jgi:hypothetical protein
MRFDRVPEIFIRKYLARMPGRVKAKELTQLRVFEVFGRKDPMAGQRTAEWNIRGLLVA